jgi:glucose/arabinose dehydrogenase
MRRTQLVILLLLVAVVTVAGTGCSALYLPFGLTVNFSGGEGAVIPDDQLAQRIKLAPGFSITTYATGITNARMLRFTATGDLLVSAPRQGKVFLVQRGSAPGYSDATVELVKDLHSPNGLALRGDWLYVAESNGVVRFGFDAQSRRITSLPERIITDLPDAGRHWTRTVGIGPDDRLYVSVGSSCNVCVEEDARRAAISVYNLDGSGGRLYATGLRNSVGFTWRPQTGEMYATDNGRDLLGDDFPPCELNRIVDGGFYGWPYANGNRVADPDEGEGREALIAASLPPVHAFGAHTAPLGLTFYEASNFPEPYRSAAFVALHGSWNRSTKSGYQEAALVFNSDGSIREEAFVSFLDGDTAQGRPVDLAVGPDGALYVSDDFTGSIYRIAYGPKATPRAVAASGGLAGDPLAALNPTERAAADSRGRALWDAKACATCHQPGDGRQVYKPLVQLARKYDIDSLAAFLKTPQPPMPAFPFSDAERRDLAIHLLAAHP